MLVDWLSLGVVSLGLLAVGVFADSTGRHGYCGREKRPLLLAYSYRNALSLARACKVKESGRVEASRSGVTEKSCPEDSEEEDRREP